MQTQSRHSHSSVRQTSAFCRAVRSWGMTGRSWPPLPGKTGRTRVSVTQNTAERRGNSKRLRSCRGENRLLFCSDLQFVFEKAHVGDSVVDLRQQRFHILHCDAEKKQETFKETFKGISGVCLNTVK